jgi:hypothetical protein
MIGVDIINRQSKGHINIPSGCRDIRTILRVYSEVRTYLRSQPEILVVGGELARPTTKIRIFDVGSHHRFLSWDLHRAYLRSQPEKKDHFRKCIGDQKAFVCTCHLARSCGVQLDSQVSVSIHCAKTVTAFLCLVGVAPIRKGFYSLFFFFLRIFPFFCNFFHSNPTVKKTKKCMLKLSSREKHS